MTPIVLSKSKLQVVAAIDYFGGTCFFERMSRGETPTPLKHFLILFFCLQGTCLLGQDTVTLKRNQKDLIDVAGSILKTKWLIERDTLSKKSGRLYFSGAPSIGYSLTSGWAGIFVGDAAFFTSEYQEQKISIVYIDLLYTQKDQFVARLQSNIWTRNNKLNLVSDWRYYWYPQKTYGLGGQSTLENFVDQTYSYIRFHQTVLAPVIPNWYFGLGLAYDYHYDIVQNVGSTEVLDQINQYGLGKNTTSAGLLVNVLYDDRINSINPWGGTYFNFVYRPNFTFFGSDASWQMLSLDVRRYIPFPRHSENILALWNYNWFTFAGNAPYLDLPATGWDPFSNTGRGYIQGRFRSKNLVYGEAEYRFKILRNGLVGGVAFVNAQTVTNWPGNNFNGVAFGVGTGLRLKFNKYSRTNVCIDYAWGQGGSQGVFVNLGEVF
ncbi:MAG: BamA/TamA family outer membrane protein [Bacteroidetes bacterium]|nr:BamA/TamA family outer membrane protein [Bacteroidota bacterium]